MPYIDATKAKQIVAIAKDYLGTNYLKFVQKSANGCYPKNKTWTDLLCFYMLYRQAGHRIDDLINDISYQKIIIKLLGEIALTPNYSLATCNSNVIITNGGCGCGGGSSTTGPVAGCTDGVLPFKLGAGVSSLTTPALIGVQILIVIREGIVMSAYPNEVNGYIFDNVTGTFLPNSPAGPSGESFIILYKDCRPNGSGIPIPVVGLRTGTQLFSGDGSTTTFNINHGGFPFTPTFYVVGIGAPASAGTYYYTVNSVNIVVTFDVAPVFGLNNIILTWAAR
jgi:hypothetical protein